MRVQKRNGQYENVSFDKILVRLRNLSNDLNVNVDLIAQKVINHLKDAIETKELDELAARISTTLITEHPDYGILGSRIIISNHHKNTSSLFSTKMEELYLHYDFKGDHCPIINKDLYEFTMKHKTIIDAYIDYNRDYEYDYFAFKTLEKSYLLRIQLENTSNIIERPQDMLMRVSLSLHLGNLNKALKSYDTMSRKYFTHASPTLFNAGGQRQQLSSCFLLHTEDSIEGIYKTITDCAKISKWAGGIGVHISNIRSKNALIRGTNGKTTGIVPMLRVYNDTAIFVNQCMIPETIIYTKDGPKQICDITTNDFVITKDGTFKPVNEVIKTHVSKNILKIRTQQSFEPLYVTTEHELYVLKGQNKELNYSLIKNRLDKGVIKPQFIPASQLEDNDLVCYPELQNLHGDNDNELDFYRIVGILLGDGHITKKKNGEYYEYGITVNRDSKIETYNFVKQFLTSNNIHYWESEQVNCIQIRWSTNIGVSKEDIYDEHKEKYIHSKFFNLSKQQTLQLIKGLIETDGSNLKELYFYSSSYKLAHGLRYLLLKLGIPSSGNIQDRIGYEGIVYEPCERTIITKKLSYCLRIPKAKILEEIIDFPQKGKYYKYFKHDNMIWSRIKKIDSVYYEGDVFDLNIQDNHNYVVGSFGLVHNSGKRNGSFAIYLEPHHPDIFDFLEIRKNHGDELQRARDLFTAMWLNNVFFERVKNDEIWSLFDPDECPGLNECYGDEYRKLYEKYEQEQKYRKQVKARDLWKAMIISQIETGTPYVLNKDACNENSNQKNIGTIKSSNLCVSGDTMILTDKGYFSIKELHNQKVNVWNGEEFSETTINQTGINQELMKISFSNGSELKCTPYHKFYIQDKTIRMCHRQDDIIKSKNVQLIEAKDLKEGMKLIKCKYPIINNEYELKFAYTNGFFSGDGTYIINPDIIENKQCSYKSLENLAFCKRHLYQNQNTEPSNMCQGIVMKKKPMVSLYGEKINLLHNLEYTTYGEIINDKLNVILTPFLEDKFFVPINYSLKSKLEWLAGYLDADGSIQNQLNTQALQVCSIHKEFLDNVKYMLQTCGIDPKISLMKNSTETLLPNGKGEYDYYNVKTCWRLLICANDLKILIENGLQTHRLKIKGFESKQNQANFIKILSREYLQDKEDTYCFNEIKRHLGIFNGIPSSQCSEIIEYSDKDEYAVCVLSSICLPKFIENGTFNHQKLFDIMQVVVDNLNQVIDKNYYPVPETKTSNMKHRPLGIGVQGLADVYAQLRMPYDSPEAKQLNKEIFETMYYSALYASCEQSKDFGPYSTFKGSPLSEGQFQFNLWGLNDSDLTKRWNWQQLRENIQTNGVRNSLLIALMPTASTSQIMGNNESFEAYTTNIYTRTTLAGDFVLVNKYLINDLIRLGLWNSDMKDKIIYHHGSIQAIEEIPLEIRNLYKTIWEISQKVIIDQAADRGPFVCQSQSMNLYFQNPTYAKISSALLYGWSKGLKTLSYYTRSKTAVKAQQFSLDAEKVKQIEQNLGNNCESCSG